MKKLSLAPDVQGYGVTDAAAHVLSKIGGGRNRIRRDFTGNPLHVEVQWTCDAQEYDYLQSFYRVQEEGTLPFLMDLITYNVTVEEHECQFVPGSWRLATVKGGTYVVKAKLEVIPPVADSELDEGIVTTFEGFGPDGSASYALLAQLVNVDFPNAIDGS